MAEPSLALSFEDLIIRVSEFLGIAEYGASGDEAAQIPTDAHDLDSVKRVVNDGWRRFANSNPLWNWLAPTFTITFDADGDTDRTVDAPSSNSDAPRAARYYMPDGFYGHMLAPFTYGPSGPRLRIDEAPESQIRQLYAAAGTTTGDPYLYAMRPLANLMADTQQNRRWEVIFYPTPDGSETVTARCRIYPHRLVADEDRHTAGFQHDEAVLASCLAEAERQKEDNQGVMMQHFTDALTRSLAMDMRTAPRNLGYNRDGSDDRLGPRVHPYTGVDTYNDISVV